MAARSIASLTLSFGLVNVPVKLYSATESSSSVSFKMLAKDGSRVKQQYVSESTGKVVERSEMVKGYEFEKDRFVLFAAEELKALDEAASHVIDIVAFVPEKSVDPIYYDRAYFLAPDKRGGKPYALLAAAMRESGRCALARWTSKGKQYVVQVRAVEDGLVLQQLLYADEVRSLKDLGIEPAEVSSGELKLALQLIDQISKDAYDPTEFVDEEKQRILAAIDAKIAGKEVVASAHSEEPSSGQVIDLMEALRASIGARGGARGQAAAPAKAAKPQKSAAAESIPAGALKERKPAKRAPRVEEPAVALVSGGRGRARK
ncbi:Ku protein [Ideonella sp. DXS29W]|uniref:Non-homologous end joining protein Ku n=1 Tax=Ideonella lacteola TaxID=2984193 RepID=A0ABU9BWA5_9BURK